MGGLHVLNLKPIGLRIVGNEKYGVSVDALEACAAHFPMP